MESSANTVIIGAGHAGLSMSYWLTQKKIPHIVLEKGRVGERWRSERWDSLTLLTPNWMTQLPGFHYKGDNPDGFDTRDQYISYLEEYAKSFNAPVQEHTSVIELTKEGEKFLIKTDKGEIKAENVVVATGPFHTPKIPEFSKNVDSSIVQLHSNSYKNPSQLPEGAVLVVGSGNSGLQIAEDLIKAGKKVFISVSTMRRAPRRHRGKDFIYWLDKMGKLDQTVDSLPSEEAKKVPPPLLTGVDNGHDLNLLELMNKGATLLGHIEGIKDGKLILAADVKEKVQKAEEAFIGLTKAIDQYIEENHIEAPPQDVLSQEIPNIEEPSEIDLKENNITSIIWATGFKTDFSWIKLDVFDEKGEPVHNRGVTGVKGLYFLGLRWLHKYKSFFIYGVGEDAQYLADQIS